MATCIVEIVVVKRLYQRKIKGQSAVTTDSPWYASCDLPGGSDDIRLASGLETKVKEGWSGLAKVRLDSGLAKYPGFRGESYEKLSFKISDMLDWKDGQPVIFDSMDQWNNYNTGLGSPTGKSKGDSPNNKLI